MLVEALKDATEEFVITNLHLVAGLDDIDKGSAAASREEGILILLL